MRAGVWFLWIDFGWLAAHQTSLQILIYETLRDAMTRIYDDRPDSEQPRVRQVGESVLARPQQAFEEVARTDAEIDQQVEQVRWLMRHEPVLEREMRP